MAADRWLTVHEVNVHVRQNVLGPAFNSTTFRFQRDGRDMDWTRISWVDGPAVQWVDDLVRPFTQARWMRDGRAADMQQVEVRGVLGRKCGFSPVKGYLLSSVLSVRAMAEAEDLWAEAARGLRVQPGAEYFEDLEVRGVTIREGWMAQQIEEIARAVVLGHLLSTSTP